MTTGSGYATSLSSQGVHIVACTFVDNAGVTRVKGVPVGRIERAARFGVGLSNTFAVFAVDDHITSSPGFEGPSGDMRLLPDLSAAVALTEPSGWAWAPVDQYDQSGDPMSVCQRTALKRAVAAAADRGFEFRMTFEVEFTLFDADEVPLHDGPGYSPRAFLPAEDFSLALVQALELQGILVDQVHPEYSKGQYEVSVGARSPLEAADQYVLLRTTITRLAHLRGLKACFAPVAIPGEVGNGCHLHFSPWKDGRNLMAGGEGAEEMQPEAERMLAGVVRRLRELAGLFAPSITSWERLQPGHWAGAYTCWGLENREAAIRLCKGMVEARETSANCELKMIDGTANPYLAAAVLIGACMAGLDDGAALPPPVAGDPHELSERERADGEVHRLPEDLGEAIGELEKSELLREVLGEPLFEAFVAVRRFEWETFSGKEPEEVFTAHRWRYG